MRRRNPILVLVVMLAFSVSGRATAPEPPTWQRPIRWANTVIKIALSTSLTSGSTSITAGSDVAGALQRALDTWSAASGIKFELVTTQARSISAPGAGDGINLITVASTPENLAIFRSGNDAAQTRVHFDLATGLISEADIVLNPYPRYDGKPLLFSTDGTPGTYDLESTFAHEIGHVLGLNHSPVVASTMQETQGVNGMFGKQAFEARTLSEADKVAVLALYGRCENLGTVSGKVFKDIEGRAAAVNGAHVWIEEVSSGRVVGSGLVGGNGKFNIGCLAVGQYRAIVENVDDLNSETTPAVRDSRTTRRTRVFRRTEISSSFKVVADSENPLSFLLAPIQNASRRLKPLFFGTNGELSTVPITGKPGTSVQVYVGGPGFDQVSVHGLRLSSHYLSVDPESLVTESTGPTSVIRFTVTIAADAPAGDYTLKFESKSGEIAYLVGALSVGTP